MRTASLIVLVAAALTLGCNIDLGPDPQPAPDPTTNGGATTSAQEACASSCQDGCCTPEGQCVAGTAETACGSAGRACKVCPDTQRCEQSAAGGECRACSQSNCNGCCTLEGQCLAGTSEAACGSAGDTCVDCGAGYCAPWGTGGGRCQ